MVGAQVERVGDYRPPRGSSAAEESDENAEANLASPIKYVAMSEQAEPASPPTAATNVSPTESEKTLLHDTATVENALTSVRIGYGKYADKTLAFMHKHNEWYLKWVVTERIVAKDHAKHLEPGLRVRRLRSNSLHAQH